MRVSAGIRTTLPTSVVFSVDGDYAADGYEDTARLRQAAFAEGCHVRGGEGIASLESPAEEGSPLRRGVIAVSRKRNRRVIAPAHVPFWLRFSRSRP